MRPQPCRAAHARPVLACRRGAVMIELLIAFMPIFTLFLGIMQLVVLSVARLVVQHAAVVGARAACVVLDDDPRYYDASPRGDIAEPEGAGDVARDRELARRLAPDADSQAATSPPATGTRMAAIRRAVYVKLAAIAPEPWHAAKLLLHAGTSVSEVLGDAPSTRLLFGLAQYLPVTTAVTLPQAPGSAQLWSREQRGDEVTVRVTHLFACGVPVVAALVCERLVWDGERGALAAPSGSKHASAIEELRRAPQAGAQAAFAAARVPVAVLQAEATLPAQRAPYRYLRERRQEQTP